MSLKEFRKLALQFTDDIRSLARKELMDELKASGVFRPKREMYTAAPVKRRPCRVPGCGQVSKGPRFDFFCAEHRTMSKSAKEAVKRGEPLPEKKTVVKKAKVVVAKPSAPAPKNGNGSARLIVIDGKKGIEHNGLKLTYEQWAVKLGMNKDAVRHRVARGKTALEALTR